MPKGSANVLGDSQNAPRRNAGLCPAGPPRRFAAPLLRAYARGGECPRAGVLSRMILALRSVNVGVPRVIAILNDRPVVSGIVKSPVSEAEVRVGLTNIEGDAQAD